MSTWWRELWRDALNPERTPQTVDDEGEGVFGFRTEDGRIVVSINMRGRRTTFNVEFPLDDQDIDGIRRVIWAYDDIKLREIGDEKNG